MLSSAATHSWFATQDWETDPAVAGWDQHRRARWAWRKMRKARRWARMLAWVPGVRMIAVGNALGYGNCRDDSDIDLVIVAASHRIWTVRLTVVALLKLFHQRPGEHGRLLSPSSRGGVGGGGVGMHTSNNHRDALCPSFFLTTDALKLEPLQLPARKLEIGNWKLVIPPDPYLLFWPTQLTVLYDRDNTYEQFWNTNVPWVRRWLPDAEPRSAHVRFVQRNSLTQFCTVVQNCVMRFFHPLEPLVERWAKRMQEPRLRRLFPQANGNTSVIIRDDMLKFHSTDRRAEFRERWVVEMCAPFDPPPPVGRRE